MLSIDDSNYGAYTKIYETLYKLLLQEIVDPQSCNDIFGVSYEILMKNCIDLKNSIESYERSFNKFLMSLKPNTYYEIKINEDIKEYIKIVSIDKFKDESKVETIRITKNGNLFSNLLTSKNYINEYSKTTQLCRKLRKGTITELEEKDWNNLVTLVENVREKYNTLYK